MNYLEMAYELATISPDPSSQNAAVLVQGSKEIYAYNHPKSPRVFKDREERLKFTEHAERAAIFHAARAGVCTLNSVLYCPWVACMDCARAIVFSGVAKVVCHAERMALPSSWDDEIKMALKYMTDNDVVIEKVSCKFRTHPILVSGKYWEP